MQKDTAHLCDASEMSRGEVKNALQLLGVPFSTKASTKHLALLLRNAQCALQIRSACVSNLLAYVLYCPLPRSGASLRVQFALQHKCSDSEVACSLTPPSSSSTLLWRMQGIEL